jgi:hypothetical protein
MRIAVYTIALNEAQFAKRWADSCKEADLRLVADTGSTDSTIADLTAQGVNVQSIRVSPWRFDHARRQNLDLIPADIDVCIALDMDEVLLPGWRQALERAWTPTTNRLRYTYHWTLKDGKPLVTFMGDKIHARDTHQWRYPAHECLVIKEHNLEVVTQCPQLVIEHHPDLAKSRSSYLNLLRTGAHELPGDARMAHYFGRELMFIGQFDAAIAELKRHLSLPSAIWYVERSQSMLYIARCLRDLGRIDESTTWFLHAGTETWNATGSGWREPWCELAQMLYDRRDYSGGLWAALRALAIPSPCPGMHTNAAAFAARPHDIASICAWHLGAMRLAREQLELAITHAPSDQRLIGNRKWMETGTSGT